MTFCDILTPEHGGASRAPSAVVGEHRVGFIPWLRFNFVLM
jgi:hypothetical protein